MFIERERHGHASSLHHVRQYLIVGRIPDHKGLPLRGHRSRFVRELHGDIARRIDGGVRTFGDFDSGFLAVLLNRQQDAQGEAEAAEQ